MNVSQHDHKCEHCSCIFFETLTLSPFALNPLSPIDVFRRQRDRITQCSLSIDREFGLLVRDGLLFTSLSLAGPCKHQWSLCTRPYQQYVRCRVQVSVCEPLGSVFTTSCIVPTVEPRIRPPSVSLQTLKENQSSRTVSGISY